MDLERDRSLSPRAARRLLTVTGLGVLALTAVVLYARSVETTEIVAALLFIPIYLALVRWKEIGGLVAALAASAVYAFLRLGGVDTLERSEQVGLVLSRSAAYLVFGLVGGAAVRLLDGSLDKLDRTDVTDDDTGLHNARFLDTELELETARAERYGSSFSVAEVDLPVPALAGVRGRRRQAMLAALGDVVRDTVRLVDRAGVVRDGDVVRVLAILPETASDGGRIVAERLAERLGEELGAHGARFASPPEGLVHVHPGDAGAIAGLRTRLAAAVAAEFDTSGG